jgi:hypothetical protein
MNVLFCLQVAGEQHACGQISCPPSGMSQCSTDTSAATCHAQHASCLSVQMHVVRGYVAVRIHVQQTGEGKGNLHGNDAFRASSEPRPPSAALTLQQLQEELTATVQNAEQRHRDRCKQALWSGATLPAASPASITTAISLMTLLAQVLLPRSAHVLSAATRPETGEQQHTLSSLGLKLEPIPAASGIILSNAGMKESLADDSSCSDRVPMPHTPNVAANLLVPPSPVLRAAAAAATGPRSPRTVTANTASHDHLNQSPLIPHTPFSMHTADPPSCIDAVPANGATEPAEGEAPRLGEGAGTTLSLGPFANDGAEPNALSQTSSQMSPRVVTSNILSQGSGCTLATEDSGVPRSPQAGAGSAARTAWPADIGVSRAEWMAALMMLPYLPHIFQRKIDALTQQQVRPCMRSQLTAGPFPC